MTKKILEKQNKDLRTRLDNANTKRELERNEYEAKLSEMESKLKEKDAVILTLQKEIHFLNESIEERISAAVAKAVSEAVSPLVLELSKAYGEIERLRAIINRDSSNSSKPPSTNGFKQIPNNRKKSGLKQGGQKGHPGHRLSLPEDIDELEEKGYVERRLKDHTDGVGEYVSRFTIDTEMKVIITEHRFSKDAVLPPGLYNEASYGNGVKATALLLMNDGIIAHKRLSGIISSQTHGIVNISTGTLNKFQKDFASQLTKSGELEAIKQDLLNGDVMNTDDTPIRVLERIIYPEDDGGEEPPAPTYERAEKKSYRATVRTHSNDRSTLYTANPKKDMEGIERDGILPEYMGKLCHDHESKFYNYGKGNGTCGGHLLRNLVGLRDLGKCPWAEEMRAFVSGMNTYKNNDLASGSSFCDPERLSEFELKYDQIIENGHKAIGAMTKAELGYTDFNAMLNRLTNYKDSYMLFMRDYKVPFTNNLAERDLRSEKTKEKVSGMFRSWDGIVAHSKVRSFISTAKKRSMDLYSSIRQVMQGESVLS